MPLCFIYISKCLLVLMLLATWLTTYKDYLAHNETELALFFPKETEWARPIFVYIDIFH